MSLHELCYSWGELDAVDGSIIKEVHKPRHGEIWTLDHRSRIPNLPRRLSDSRVNDDQ